MNEVILISIVATYFIAGLIKGTLGIGFPTAAIALTAIVLDARTAIATVVIPMCLINAWQIFRTGHLLDVIVNHWRLVTSMVIFIAVFSILSVEVPIRGLTLMLGVAITIFAVFSLWKTPPVLPDQFNHGAQWAAGAVSGVMGGLAGIWAPPIIVYLTSRRVSTAQFIQIVGVLLFIGSAILLAGYIRNGMIHAGNALFSATLLLPAIAGFTVGEWLRRKLANDMFQKLVLLFFLILGLNFIRRAIFM